jgi:hypothetical protein
MRALPPLLAVLALAACTPAGWQRPGSDSAALDTDLAGCTRQAQHDAIAAAPSEPAGPRLLPFAGGRDLENPTWDMPQELLLQQSLRNACLRAKGYRLVPESTAAVPPQP